MADLNGKTAVVTGSARGIGRAIAERLADDGAHLVVSDVQDGSATVESIEDAGGSAEFREGDVTSEESMREVVDGLTVDVLVNNAAYYAPLVGNKKRFDEIDGAEWNEVMEVNSTGVFLASKAALPRIPEGGSIVNISSMTAIKGSTGFLHYVASKAAVLGITRAMANELGDEGIRVNAVMPGFTASEASMQAGEDYLDASVETRAIKRRIEPEDIASSVAFLAGPDSGMVSGQALNVDGGELHY